MDKFYVHNLISKNFFTSFYIKILLSQFFCVGDQSFPHVLSFLLKITPTIYIPFERGDFQEYFTIRNLILNFFNFLISQPP